MAIFSKLGRYDNTALLLMRIGLGIMMMMHGYPKLAGGAERWAKLGSNMRYIGVHIYPIFWGFMASITECIGGLFLLIGFFFRPTAFFLMFVMIIATMSHIYGGGSIMDASESIELGVVFLALFIIGPGLYSADKS